MWPFNLQKRGEKAVGRETIGMFTRAEMTVIVICSGFKIKGNHNLFDLYVYITLTDQTQISRTVFTKTYVAFQLAKARRKG